MYEEFKQAVEYDDFKDWKKKQRLIKQLEKMNEEYKQNKEKKELLIQIDELTEQIRQLG